MCHWTCCFSFWGPVNWCYHFYYIICSSTIHSHGFYQLRCAEDYFHLFIQIPAGFETHAYKSWGHDLPSYILDALSMQSWLLLIISHKDLLFLQSPQPHNFSPSSPLPQTGSWVSLLSSSHLSASLPVLCSQNLIFILCVLLNLSCPCFGPPQISTIRSYEIEMYDNLFVPYFLFY
jgi:hypothetical protein